MDESPPKVPRWVKIFGMVAIALVVLAVIIVVISGGEHGPGRHIPDREQGGHRSPSLNGR